MAFAKRYQKEVVLGILLFLNIFVWFRIGAEGPSKLLKVSFLDIGQGDAILIETPSHHQMLIDGGRNKKVVSLLGEILPFGDRSLDIVLATHPDADHIGGLPEVFARYDINLFMKPGVEGKSSLDTELDKRVADEHADTLLARSGETIDFGDGVKLVILYPNQDVTHWKTNDASIVAKLVYGEKSFLLTGDAEIKTENALLSRIKEDLNVDVLKAGHHGSRTSTSLAFAQAVSPEYAVISAGKDNTYGHPHKEVLATLAKVGAKILSTIDLSTITFETDGQTLRVK